VLFSYPIRASLLRIGRAEHETFGGCPTEIINRLVGALQRKTATTWGIGKGEAAGPTPSHDGHPPGFTVFAIMEPLECVATMETVSNDRIANMAACSPRDCSSCS
jgi:nicotinamide mononucleotide (NMN) deamidase PncC